jgi:thiosulfate/3-mercaptopyruvate sulfurtransferase
MNYAHPFVLVDTDFVEDHLKDSERVRIAEVDYNVYHYSGGHIPETILLDWNQDLNDPVNRNILTKEACENLLQKAGVNDDTTLILYGDFNNWFAAFAFWVFKYYGYKDVRLMNGGRKKWLIEDRPVNKDIPQYSQGNFKASDADNSIRVFLNNVKHSLDKVRKDTAALVDVRSPKEFTGEILAPLEYPLEQAQRGGHIPGAKNIPWSDSVNDNDGTFKSIDELKELYESKGVTPDKEVIAYCRIGERSSHTWFVLKYLLGYPIVKNYDGSWTEWGNMVASPIEK